MLVALFRYIFYYTSHGKGKKVAGILSYNDLSVIL